jgi:tripartite-type tricarboxylate transporter receptor subunit TctC
VAGWRLDPFPVFAHRNLNYNFTADFAPIANIIRTPLIVLVNPSVEAKSAAELIALAKASPGKLNLASGGVGSTGHMAAELFQMMAGIKFTHVPYRGEALALVDLIAGHAQVMFSITGSPLQYAKAGTVRALATTTDDRVVELHDVPPLSRLCKVIEPMPGTAFLLQKERLRRSSR